jgi:hypothetical protein
MALVEVVAAGCASVGFIFGLKPLPPDNPALPAAGDEPGGLPAAVAVLAANLLAGHRTLVTPVATPSMAPTTPCA